MSSIRDAAVAGSFYPRDARELSRQVRKFLDAAPTGVGVPKAIIAPHAGYVYSGPVAGSAYANIVALRERVTRVVLLGPAHRVWVRGIAASTKASFRTPLGGVALDQGRIRGLVSELPYVQFCDEAHADEHSLEVHLPFLQETLERFTLLPFAVGDATAEQVETVLERLWGGAETLIVVSSDLSHFHDYATARRLDRATSDAIEQLDPDRIEFEHACGRVPVSGLLRIAAQRRLQASTVDLRNSGDTAGPHDQVVGYGAYLFREPGGSRAHRE